MRDKKGSKLLTTIHEDAKGLYDAKIFDAKTIRELDALCLPEINQLTPREIKQLRYE